MAWFQAFKELVNQLLSLDDAELNRWKSSIKAKIVDNGKVLTDAITELKLILGEQPSVAELNSMESQNRFINVVKNFIWSISSQSHPLVIFLDDLQWIDPASCTLLKELFADQSSGYFLFAGAFRENEKDLHHLLHETLSALSASTWKWNEIHISNLSLSAIEDLVSETLHVSKEKSIPMAQLVFEKTRGNAFFVRQLIYSFYEKELLKYIPNEHCWQWDSNALSSIQITNNVIDLMIERINHLPPTARKIVQYASCIGNMFEQNILNIISGLPASEFLQIMQLIVSEGLLYTVKDNYKFAHDRIQQTAYSLIPVEEKQSIHRKIGKLLISFIPQEKQEEHIFDIANQLNLSQQTYAVEETENVDSANINLKAGLKAKSNAAYTSAFSYFTSGISSLKDNSWKENYRLMLELYTGAIDSAYMCGLFSEMTDLVASAHSNVSAEIDKIFIYETEIKALAAQGKLLEAIKHGIQALNNVGYEFPEDPAWDYVFQRFEKALVMLNEVGYEGIKKLPEMKSAQMLAYMRILSALGEPAYVASPNVFMLWAAEYAINSLQYKDSSMSPFGYAAFALALCATQHFEEGYKLARVAVDMVEEPDGVASRCRVLNIYGGTILFWEEPLRNSIKIMEQGVSAGYLYGDHTSGSYACHGMDMNLLFMGLPLSQAENVLIDNLNTIKHFKQEFIWDMDTSMLEAIRVLRGSNLSTFPLENFNRQESIKQAIEINNFGSLGLYFLCTLFAEFILDCETETKMQYLITQVRQYASGFQATICVPVYMYIESLVLLRHAENSNGISQTVLENKEKLLQLSTICPVNFAHKHDLVAAEIARCKGENWEAAKLYQKSIDGARVNLFIQEEALANEIAARFYKKQEMQEIATFHIKEAFNCYKKWGATAKLLSLSSAFPGEFAKETSTDEFDRKVESIDVESIMKATHTISSERKLETLVSLLMKILIQNAGAQFGYLLLQNDGNWYIAANYNDTKDGETSTQHEDIVPQSILNFVIHSLKSVILDDACNEGEFHNDEQVKQAKSRSILCFPLIIRGELFGILYFENRLIPGAFTENRIKVLEMLATQATISIENAKYYEQLISLNQSLEKEIQERRINEQKYRLLADYSNDEISKHTIDNLCYLYVSPSCKQILGYEPEELLGRSAFEIIHPDDHQSINEAIKYISEENSVFVTFRKRRKDGTYIWAESNNHLIRDVTTGKPIEIHSCTRDITERKKIENTLRLNEQILKQQNEEFIAINEELSESNYRIQSINDELIIAKNKAEESDRLKTAFLANISHEIRTPMNGIMGFSELLKNPKLTGQQQIRYIEIINKSGERMLNIINNLVSISKIEAGIVELDIKPVQPAKILANIFDFFEPQVKKQGLELFLDIPNTPLTISTDETKLNQIVTNLLANALKFTYKGKITFGYGIRENQVLFFVSDTGMGILPEHQKIIFDRFRQAHTNFNRPYEGAGLGLSISKSYIEFLGGNITVESVPEVGSTFFFTLPLNDTDMTFQEQIKEIHNDEIESRLTILLAEDDQTNALYATEILMSDNVSVIWVKNGKEAIEQVALNPAINIILMDLKMPVMNGIEATKIIKKSEPTKKIIALTAYAASSDKDNALAAGCDDFLAKPFRKEDLIRKINNLIPKN